MRLRCAVISLAMVVLCGLAPSADAEKLLVEFSWTNPTENTDDSPLIDLQVVAICASFTWHDLADGPPACDFSYGVPTTEIGAMMAHQVEMDLPAEGTLYAWASAIDTSGNVSPWVEATALVYDKLSPKEVSLLKSVIRQVIRLLQQISK